jgi:hypothetical protein
MLLIKLLGELFNGIEVKYETSYRNTIHSCRNSD